MITRAEVEKLGAFHAVQPEVLSLYLSIPAFASDPGRPSRRVTRLIAAAEADAGPSGCLDEQDRCLALELAMTAAHDWPGRSVAIFACDDVGLAEVVPLPGPGPERAVLGVRPHIRPLLVALQEHPAYWAAVLDGRRTWVFRAQGEEITAVPERELGRGEREPLVIGGRDDEVRLMLASLTPADRAAVAGCFTAEAGRPTPTQLLELAKPVIARWAARRASRLAAEILDTPPDGLTAVGVPACLAAVSAGSADALIVPASGLVLGYECGRCGTLSLAPESCPDWGTAPLPVPDVIEEMVARVLEDGGEVCVTHDASAPVAARLRLSTPRASDSWFRR
jgi:hypothetical protein